VCCVVAVSGSLGMDAGVSLDDAGMSLCNGSFWVTRL